ncbi:hypothetical protein P9911_029460 [Klebsiella oxytoca]|uniref:hypothetical protein n=1 Tax=Klebsiella oxytoca TaxID=571 RepID=UPI00254D94A3|nr:hypothetical protein [Klebsiella oxytoca]MEC5509933.1 hypothetical protein [Klebsiella oxytoca]
MDKEKTPASRLQKFITSPPKPTLSCFAQTCAAFLILLLLIFIEGINMAIKKVLTKNTEKDKANE